MELETNLSDITPLANLHKNAFDIDRNDLLESIEKIRMHLKQPKLQNEGKQSQYFKITIFRCQAYGPNTTDGCIRRCN